MVRHSSLQCSGKNRHQNEKLSDFISDNKVFLCQTGFLCEAAQLWILSVDLMIGIIRNESSETAKGGAERQIWLKSCEMARLWFNIALKPHNR